MYSGKRIRLRSLTNGEPKVFIKVNRTLLIKAIFDSLIRCVATTLVVDYKQQIIDCYGDTYRDVPGNYAHQSEQFGIAHTIL